MVKEETHIRYKFQGGKLKEFTQFEKFHYR